MRTKNDLWKFRLTGGHCLYGNALFQNPNVLSRSISPKKDTSKQIEILSVLMRYFTHAKNFS